MPESVYILASESRYPHLMVFLHFFEEFFPFSIHIAAPSRPPFLNDSKSLYPKLDIEFTLIDSDGDFDVTDWSYYLYQFLKNIDREYILLALEDYFFSRPVDVNKILAVKRFLNTKLIDRVLQFRLFHTVYKTCFWNKTAQKIGTDNIYITDITSSQYKFDLQFSYWNREFLMQRLLGTQDPWDFERSSFINNHYVGLSLKKSIVQYRQGAVSNCSNNNVIFVPHFSPFFNVVANYYPFVVFTNTRKVVHRCSPPNIDLSSPSSILLDCMKHYGWNFEYVRDFLHITDEKLSELLEDKVIIDGFYARKLSKLTNVPERVWLESGRLMKYFPHKEKSNA